MVVRFLLFLSIFLNYASSVFGQSIADSLIQLLPQTKNDTARARLYKAITDNLEDRTQALVYAKKGLDLAKKMKWSKAIGVFNGIFGRIYTDQGDYDKGRTLPSSRNKHPPTKPRFNANIASAFNALGNLYLRQGQSSPALNAYLQALKIAEPAKLTTLLPSILSNISIIYSDQSHFDKAFSYVYKALRQNQKNKDTLGIASNLAGLANMYQLKTDTAKALTYYQRSIELLSRIKTALPELAEAYQNQALLYRSPQQKARTSAPGSGNLGSKPSRAPIVDYQFGKHCLGLFRHCQTGCQTKKRSTSTGYLVLSACKKSGRFRQG